MNNSIRLSRSCLSGGAVVQLHDRPPPDDPRGDDDENQVDDIVLSE